MQRILKGPQFCTTAAYSAYFKQKKSSFFLFIWRKKLDRRCSSCDRHLSLDVLTLINLTSPTLHIVYCHQQPTTLLIKDATLQTRFDGLCGYASWISACAWNFQIQFLCSFMRICAYINSCTHIFSSAWCNRIFK